MATQICETSLETIDFLTVNESEKRLGLWLKFCKYVHVNNCNATSMGISHEIFRQMLERARHRDCFHHLDSETVYWISIFLSFLIILINSFMILVFVRNRHLHTINNIPLFSLAVSDIILGVVFLYSASFSLLLVYAQYNFDAHHHFIYHAIRSNIYLCLIFEGPVLIFISLMSSILTLVLIAIERYIAVIHAFRYDTFITLKRIVGCIIGLWVMSIAIGILPLVGWNSYKGVCEMNALLSSSYIILWSSICFFSAAVMLFMYLRIFYVANKIHNQIHAQQYSLDWTMTSEGQRGQEVPEVKGELESISSTTTEKMEDDDDDVADDDNNDDDDVADDDNGDDDNDNDDDEINKGRELDIISHPIQNYLKLNHFQMNSSTSHSQQYQSTRQEMRTAEPESSDVMDMDHLIATSSAINSNSRQFQKSSVNNSESEVHEKASGNPNSYILANKKSSANDHNPVPPQSSSVNTNSTLSQNARAKDLRSKPAQKSPVNTNLMQSQKTSTKTNTKPSQKTSANLNAKPSQKASANTNRCQKAPVNPNWKLSQKAIKTTGIIIGSFYVCWLPFLIYIILFTSECCNNKETLYYLAVITQLNSLFNPLVYGYRQTDIRKAGGKMLGFRRKPL